MNFVKRAILNFWYKKSYNLLLILLVLILATLVLSGFAIRTASAQSCASIRRTLGGAVTMTNLSKAYRGVESDTAQRIAALKHVQSSNYIINADAYAYDFKAIDDPFSGFHGRSKKVAADINLIGFTQTAKFSGFTTGTLRLDKGRQLIAADVNKPYAMIEKSLAVQDKLDIGSKITLSAVGGSKKVITETIVGIFKDLDKDSDFGGPIARNGNEIFVPYSETQKLTQNDAFDSAVYYMDDPLNIESFKEEATKLLSKNYLLNAQDASYRRMSGSLSSLAFLSNIMVFGIMILGAVILSLIVMLTLKSRTYEIGILLSVGEKKAKIITQMALEILLPVLIAVTISIATGSMMAQQVGNVMLQSQNQSQQGVSDSGQSSTTDIYTGKTLSTVQGIKVTITEYEIIMLYAAGTAIALLSAIAPVAFVLRCSPKKILLDIE